MPSEKDNILEFNQYMKSYKMPYIIYADIEYLIEKIDEWANNPENFLTTKISEHIPCGHSMSTVWAIECFWNFKRTREKCNWFWKEKKYC